MRNRTLPLMLVAALAAGCVSQGASPTRRVIAAQDAYSSTLMVLTELRAAGKISDQRAVQIEQYRVAAAAALDLAKAEAAGGDPAAALARFDKALAEWRALMPRETP